MNWQPIETAPKDGTDILGCVAGFCPIVISWVDEIQHWSYFCEEMFNHDDLSRYFWKVYCEKSRSGQETFEPTHWMPLPQAPQ